MLKWTKKPHPIWGEGGKEERIRKIADSLHWPEFQWRSKKFSIIFPRPEISSSPKRYEFFDGKEDIWIFDTLKEAQDFAEELKNP